MKLREIKCDRPRAQFMVLAANVANVANVANAAVQSALGLIC
jgi:hypothetical protein